MEPKLPTYDRFINPTLRTLDSMGGSAAVSELVERVADDMQLTNEELAIVHDPRRGTQSEVAYRMAWARTYLKKAGLIENSQRGVWSLTVAGRDAGEVDVAALIRKVKREDAVQSRSRAIALVPLNDDEETLSKWREEVLALLTELPPSSFERLCQRLLRECGFIEVTVTGRSGDGGIDGVGVIQLQRILSFQVAFQSKRWRGTVGPDKIREFQGATVGRADKGLFITTGSFSTDARKVARRDGAPPIDLIDGDQLVDLLKSLGLGIKTEQVEQVIVNKDWFAAV